MHTNARSRRPLPPVPSNVASQLEMSGPMILDSDYPTQNNLTEPIPLTEENDTDESTLLPLYTTSSPPSFHTNVAGDNVEEANTAAVAVKSKFRQWCRTITQSKTRLFLVIFILVFGICGTIFGILDRAKIIHLQSKSAQFVTTTRTLESPPLTLDSQPPKTATSSVVITPEPSQVTITLLEPLQVTATTPLLMVPSLPLVSTPTRTLRPFGPSRPALPLPVPTVVVATRSRAAGNKPVRTTWL
ncbi:hypothetical protein Clacol_003498 [Clathrus columnatus]|uniref:CLLAC-motif containing domain-containing protein n=1 Tax=Clathrus columnatus TaxID=1419009 RepID=A0AAV5A9Q8_9AGAM|nr:hypothetical protein Clacol_003498 [Clathrus columnatus]